jgi:hypothetical protein
MSDIFSSYKTKIGDLCSPPNSRTHTPDSEISPQNRKDYYNNVFMVGSPSGLNLTQVPSPPRDAPFQSLVSITPQSSSSNRPYVSPPGDLSALTSVQRTMTSTSEFYNPQKSISSFGDAASYFPGSYEGDFARYSLQLSHRRAGFFHADTASFILYYSLRISDTYSQTI